MKEKLIEKIKPHRCLVCQKSNQISNRENTTRIKCVICKAPLCQPHMKEHISILKRNIQIPDVSQISMFVKTTKDNEICLICQEPANYISYSHKPFCEKHLSFFLIEEFGLCKICNEELALYDCLFCHLPMCSKCVFTHHSPKHKPYTIRIADEIEEFNPKCSICKKSTHIFSFVISNTICPECLNSHKSSSHTPTPTHTP